MRVVVELQAPRRQQLTSRVSVTRDVMTSSAYRTFTVLRSFGEVQLTRPTSSPLTYSTAAHVREWRYAPRSQRAQAVRSPHVAKERQAAASLRAARCGGVSPQTRAVDALQTRAPPVMGKPLCKRGETIGDYKISGPFIGEGSFAEARTGCTRQPQLPLFTRCPLAGVPGKQAAPCVQRGCRGS